MADIKYLNYEGLQQYHNNLKGYMAAPSYIASWTKGKNVDSTGAIIDATPEMNRRAYLSNKFYMPIKFTTRALIGLLDENGTKSIVHAYDINGNYVGGWDSFNIFDEGHYKDTILSPSEGEYYYRWYIEVPHNDFEVNVFPTIDEHGAVSTAEIDTIWSSDGGGMPSNT